MCGIIGYVGKNNPKNFLINSLKKLEYRGYDSCGVAFKNDNNVQIIKSVGRIVNLENKINNTNVINSNIGIAHTRWATHGGVNEINAHPHRYGKVTIVHNGIIENADSIKKELLQDNYLLNSETDTEVIAALMNKYLSNNKLETINNTIKKLKGSYALAIMFDDEDKIYALRKDSPLIIGYGKNENYIASDIIALCDYTKEYSLIDEGEIVVLDKDKVFVYKNNKIVQKEHLINNIINEDANKCGFEHYMLKEIYEEPEVLDNLFKRYNDIKKDFPNLKDYEEIHIVACGSALYAGMIASSLIEEELNIKCYTECASEYRYKKVIYNKKTLVILISQSGETADTIAALRMAKSHNIETLSIVNVETSTIARESDKSLFIKAGAEIAVATTKAYILQVAMMILMVLYTKNDIKSLNDMKIVPHKIKEVLNDANKFKEASLNIYKHENAFFIGRKIDYAMCLEGSLKLKEISYIHSDAFQAGELKHGTISLIDNNTPVIAIITDKSIKDKTWSNVIEVKSRNANVFLITNDNSFDDLGFKYVIPKVNHYYESLLVIPVLQLIAYYTAYKKGLDIDKPRNLAKSVTVE